MKVIRKALQAYLKSLHPRAYFQVAPDDAQNPYLVYDIQIIGMESKQWQAVIDIDGWDVPEDGDTTALETLMETIAGDGDLKNPTGLNRCTLLTDSSIITLYLDRVIPLTDDDKRIKRRKQIYNAKIIGRS